MTPWLNRAALALLWPAVTAGVAFLVARSAGDDAAADIIAPIPPIAAEQRGITL